MNERWEVPTFTRTFLAAALFAAAIRSPALAQQVPQALESYKPHEIVEAVSSEAGVLHLTAHPVKRLDDLHVSVRDERHRWAGIPGNQAPMDLKKKPMFVKIHS